jgi:hypothetical protein
MPPRGPGLHGPNGDQLVSSIKSDIGNGLQMKAFSARPRDLTFGCVDPATPGLSGVIAATNSAGGVLAACVRGANQRDRHRCQPMHPVSDPRPHIAPTSAGRRLAAAGLNCRTLIAILEAVEARGPADVTWPISLVRSPPRRPRRVSSHAPGTVAEIARVEGTQKSRDRPLAPRSRACAERGSVRFRHSETKWRLRPLKPRLGRVPVSGRLHREVALNRPRRG